MMGYRKLNDMYPNSHRVDSSVLSRPILIVVVDTEEDFDWGADPDRSERSVGSASYLNRVQDIFDEYGILPCYVVDYPIVEQPESADVLRDIHARGGCEIGAHLHPWVNPPYSEQLSRQNMYPGNLDAMIEREKLRHLKEKIEDVFGFSPVAYKAGRYGFGPATAATLEALGFRIDLSICPAFDHSGDGGPDFSRESAAPFWFGSDANLLAIPVTGAFVGWGRRASPTLYSLAKRLESLKVPGILSRLRLVDRLVLSPEGYSPKEHRAITKFLYAQGLRTFTWSFHSSSVEPGNTSYVRTKRDLDRFLDSFRRYFDFFLGEFNGEPSTPTNLYARLEKPTC